GGVYGAALVLRLALSGLLLAENALDGGLGELFGATAAADADGARDLAVDHDRHAARAREVADPDRGTVALTVDVGFQRRGRALPMRGGLGFQNRRFGEGGLAAHGVEVDEHAGDIDDGAADGFLLRHGLGDASVDDLARGGWADLLAFNESGLRRNGDGEHAGGERSESEL